MQIELFDKIKGQLGFDSGILGKEEFFNSVVMVLLMKIDGEYHFVFQKRAEGIRQAGEICFPGGKIDESDKTLQQVALRETCEEMGICPDKIEIVGKLDTLVAPMGVTVDAFIGIADVSLADLHVNEQEVAQVITIPVSYFLQHTPDQYNVFVEVHHSIRNKETGEVTNLLPVEQLGLPAAYKSPWGNFRYNVWVYNTNPAVIWGITARIVREVAEKINRLM